ncbi:MAG: DUF2332 family protein [Pseudomonadota bacterium]|nr:DUF2332 family protein [Pseudomonadota bacterium]
MRAAFAEQAMWCERLGSPFMARLCELLGRHLDRRSATGERILSWPGDPSPSSDVLPLRLCGGLHALVRAGRLPELAALYPPNPAPADDLLWPAIADAIHEADDELGPWLDLAPQTNEVGRSAVLMAGLMTIAADTKLPLRLFELGSSAGLNLLLDLYGYTLGGIRAGAAASPLQLAPEWRGPPPPKAPVEILSRGGVDLRPVDLPGEGEKLLAYVWPDQLERRSRLEAAIAVSAADPPAVAKGDAAEWLERVLPLAPAAGAVRVVMHSIAFQYFPAGTQQRIAALNARCGAAADKEGPLAWLRYEHESGDDQASLRVRSWPGGEDRLLAWCHPHGATVDWVVSMQD